MLTIRVDVTITGHLEPCTVLSWRISREITDVGGKCFFFYNYRFANVLTRHENAPPVWWIFQEPTGACNNRGLRCCVKNYRTWVCTTTIDWTCSVRVGFFPGNRRKPPPPPPPDIFGSTNCVRTQTTNFPGSRAVSSKYGRRTTRNFPDLSQRMTVSFHAPEPLKQNVNANIRPRAYRRTTLRVDRFTITDIWFTESSAVLSII